MKTLIPVVLFILVAVGAWFLLANRNSEPVPENVDSKKEITSTKKEEMPTTNPIVTLKTNKGDIAIELFVDTMPITAGNFKKLAEEDFYHDVKFHRVIKNFMIQSGDPNSKEDDQSRYGTGGPGYTIEDEFAEGLSNVRGTIAMANSGPNTGGSQFFINVVDNSTSLDNKHPVFGKVIEGMDIVDTIVAVATGARDIPLDPVIIEDIVISSTSP